MAGDKFNVQVNSWYKSAKEQTIDPPSGILTELFYALNNAIGGLQGGSKADPSELYNSEVLLPGATTFINNQSNSSNNNSPRAYLNWILFDEQFNYVSVGSGFEQVPEESYYNNNDIPNNITKLHVHDDLPITKSGFLYIYVSNETPNIDVFFDNLTVTHIRGQILEETHYYPFGLTMAGISSKAAGKLQNKIGITGKELQNKEFSDGSGLEEYDFGSRFYDMQIGRWNVIDPQSQRYSTTSPYAYCINNPIIYVDPNGEEITVTVTTVTGKDELGNPIVARTHYHYGKDKNGKYGFMDDKGNKYSGSDSYLLAVATALDKIRTGGERGAELIDYLMNTKDKSVNIMFKESNSADKNGKEVYWNQDMKKSLGVDTKGSNERDPFIGLGHELAHTEGIWKDIVNNKKWQTIRNSKQELEDVPNSEIYATHVENQLRAENNMPLREYYASDPTNMGENAGTRLINTRTGASLYVDSNGTTNFKKLRGNKKGFIYKKL